MEHAKQFTPKICARRAPKVAMANILGILLLGCATSSPVLDRSTPVQQYSEPVEEYSLPATPVEATDQFLAALKRSDFRRMAMLHCGRGAGESAGEGRMADLARRLTFKTFSIIDSATTTSENPTATVSVQLVGAGEPIDVAFKAGKGLHGGWQIYGYTILTDEEWVPKSEWIGEISVRWELVASSTDAIAFIDPATLTVGRFSRAWVFLGYREPQNRTGSTLFDNIRVLREYNCRLRETRVLQTVTYRGHEVVQSTSVPNPDWESPIPESVGEAIFDRVCATIR